MWRKVWDDASALDVVVAAYLVALAFLAWQGHGLDREECVFDTLALLVAYGTGLVLVRGGLLGRGRSCAVAYRLLCFGAVQASYFLLRKLLPEARADSYDAQLFHLDARLFGAEPTLLLDRFVGPRSTEWFAFFYFSYFVILAVHVLPMMFLSRRPRLLAEFGVTLVLVFCTAHLLYFVVPGYGPHTFLAASYDHPLPSGRFLELVFRTVNAGGAQKDIFPSLHTAGPTAIALFSYRHRREAPFRWTWPIVAFFAANIVGATIFLRWHYVIDVFGGLLLAAIAVPVAHAWVAREESLRAARGTSPSWPPLWPETTEASPCTCPRCGAAAAKVLFYAAPMRMCSREACSFVWGAFCFLPLLFANRVFVRYDGSYLDALRFWLTTRQPRDVDR